MIMMGSKYAELKPDWTAFNIDFWASSGVNPAWLKRLSRAYVDKMHGGAEAFWTWYDERRVELADSLFDMPYPAEVFPQLKTAVYDDFFEGR